jgi:hypothetical protein
MHMHVYLTECQSPEAVILECEVYYFMSQTANNRLLKLVCTSHLEKCSAVLAIMPEVLLLFIERVTIASVMNFFMKIRHRNCIFEWAEFQGHINCSCSSDTFLDANLSIPTTSN